MIFLLQLAVNLMDTNSFVIPPQYRKDTTVVIHTHSTQEGIDKACGKAPEGYVKLACDHGNQIDIPNPCTAKEEIDPDTIAHKLCHEIGHKEGWHHINE